MLRQKMSALKAAFMVESRMRELHCARGQRLFFPSQLVVEPDLDLDAVLVALRQLDDEGRVVLRASVYCSEGHEIWQGPVRDVVHFLGARCDVCEDPEEPDDSPRVELRAAMSDAWREQLDADAAREEKKRP